MALANKFHLLSTFFEQSLFDQNLSVIHSRYKKYIALSGRRKCGNIEKFGERRTIWFWENAVEMENICEEFFAWYLSFRNFFKYLQWDLHALPFNFFKLLSHTWENIGIMSYSWCNILRSHLKTQNKLKSYFAKMLACFEYFVSRSMQIQKLLRFFSKSG